MAENFSFVPGLLVASKAQRADRTRVPRRYQGLACNFFRSDEGPPVEDQHGPGAGNADSVHPGHLSSRDSTEWPVSREHSSSWRNTHGKTSVRGGAPGRHARRRKADSQPSEAKMIITNYTPEDLKKLPLRAIVALSARCARRVEQRARLPDDHPEQERCRAAVANAIGYTDAFMKGAIDDLNPEQNRDRLRVFQVTVPVLS